MVESSGASGASRSSTSRGVPPSGNGRELGDLPGDPVQVGFGAGEDRVRVGGGAQRQGQLAREASGADPRIGAVGRVPGGRAPRPASRGARRAPRAPAGPRRPRPRRPPSGSAASISLVTSSIVPLNWVDGGLDVHLRHGAEAGARCSRTLGDRRQPPGHVGEPVGQRREIPGEQVVDRPPGLASNGFQVCSRSSSSSKTRRAMLSAEHRRVHAQFGGQRRGIDCGQPGGEAVQRRRSAGQGGGGQVGQPVVEPVVAETVAASGCRGPCRQGSRPPVRRSLPQRSCRFTLADGHRLASGVWARQQASSTATPTTSPTGSPPTAATAGPCEPGRYRLVVARACPWANRAIDRAPAAGAGRRAVHGHLRPDARRAQLDVRPRSRAACDPVLGIERLQEAFFEARSPTTPRASPCPAIVDVPTGAVGHQRLRRR